MEVATESHMENTEPFECCPSIGRRVSRTVPINNREPATAKIKSANPVDRIFEKLSSKPLKPLLPFGEMLFKADKDETQKLNREKATVPEDSVKPYKQWLENWEPGDPLPLIPPGFRANLCSNLGGKLLTSSERKERPLFAPMNESEIAAYGEKSLGSSLKDTVYTLRAMVAKSRGLWVDSKNKLRCSFGPNANQYTDEFGTNCLVPVKINAPSAVSSGARLGRRTATAAVVGAMDAGARDYPDGYGLGGIAGDREFRTRGRDNVAMGEEQRRQFRDGLFTLPSGKQITHYRRNGFWGSTIGDEGRRNFLDSVQELFPSVDLKSAGEFWDGLITEESPLTTLQKVQLEEVLEAFFQSMFQEAKANPEEARWITAFKIDMNINSGAEVKLDGDAVSGTNKKGQRIANPNEPVSESGFSFDMTFNPVEMYYLYQGANVDQKHTAVGNMIQSTRSFGLFTAVHEFGHMGHFSRSMANMGFTAATLGRTKSGSWKVDLRNIQNPNNLPQVARLQAMANRLEQLQTGSRWTVLPSGQRVRVYAKDVKEAVQEFYGEMFDAVTQDLGGTDQDFAILQRFTGSKYSRENRLETRAEAWAAVRLLGPEAISKFAEQESAYQTQNPRFFPNPESPSQIQDQVYQAMDNVFGPKTRTQRHERRDTSGFSPVMGTARIATTPRGVSRFMPTSLRSSQPNNRPNIPMRTPGQNTPGVSGPMRGNTSGVVGAMANHNNNKTIIKYKPDSRAAEAKTAENIVDMLAASKVLDGPIDTKRLTIEQRNALSKIVETVGTSIDTQENISPDNLNRISLRPSGSQLMSMVTKAAEIFVKTEKADPSFKLRKRLKNKKDKVARYEKAIADLEDVLNKFKTGKDNTRLAQTATKWSFGSWGSEYVSDISNSASEKLFLDAVKRTLDVYRTKTQTLKGDIMFAPFLIPDSRERRIDTMSDKQIVNYIKNSGQEHILGVLSGIDQVNKRFSWMRGSTVISFGVQGKALGWRQLFEDLPMIAEVGKFNGGQAVLETSRTGRILPAMELTLHPSEPESEKDYISEPNDQDVGKFGSKIVSSANLAYHESGHLVEHVLMARGYGLQVGPNSPTVLRQLRDVGPELGDTVTGALFAFNTGKALDTKIDSLDSVDEVALVEGVSWALYTDLSRNRTSGPSNFRMRFLSGFWTGAETGWETNQGEWSYSPERTKLIEVGGDSKDVRSDFASAEKILSDALGWDIDEHPMSNLQELLVQAEQTSRYAQTNEAEAFAETFALMMQIEQYGQLDPDGQNSKKPQQLAKMMADAIDNSVSHDKPVALSLNQKQELQRLQKKLNSLAVLSDGNRFEDTDLSTEKRASSKAVVDTREIKIIDLDNESISGTDVEIPYEWENSNGLIGRMASFQTSDKKNFLLDKDGKVISTSDRVVFVESTELNGLRFAPRYETPTFTRNGIVGVIHDETNLNSTTFAKLRERGESFNSAFVRSGGKLQKKLVPLSSKPDIGLHPVSWNDKTGKFDISGEIMSITMASDSPRGVVGRMADEHGFSGELTEVRNAFKRNIKPPERISIPSEWFIQDPKIDAEKRARQAFPDMYMRYEEQYGMRRYVPATGKLKDDASAVDKMQDADRAGYFMWRKYWMPSVASAKSELGNVLYYWRNSYSQSRALALAVGGYSEGIAETYKEDADFLKKAEILKKALEVAPPMGTKTYRTMRLTDDVGRSANVGDELKFTAAAVAWSEKTAMAYDLDELSMVANVPDKLLIEFPADTRGVLHDEMGLKQEGKYYAENGDQAPVEGIVSGRFKVSRIEERTLTNPRTGKDVKRKVHVLEAVTGRMSGLRQIKSNVEDAFDRADLDIDIADERIYGLEKALADFKKSGFWNGADYGVVLGLGNNITDGDSRFDSDLDPVNLTPDQLAIRKVSRNDMIERIEDKIELAKIESRLRKLIAEKKQIRASQNTLDVEDIPEEILEQLQREQEGLEKLYQSDQKAFWSIVNPDDSESIAAVHAGVAELDGGVLNPSKTRGEGGSPGSSGDTQALNAMQIRKIKDELKDAEGEKFSRLSKIIERLNESPKSGFLSAYRLGQNASAGDTRGYFARYPEDMVPKELHNDDMRKRWASLTRGTQYLFIGKKDQDVTNLLGASDETQIVGINPPLFGLSERANSSSRQIDKVNLAIFARATRLQSQGADVTPSSVLDFDSVGGLVGAMSTKKNKKGKRELLYERLTNAWRTKDPSDWTDQDVYYARLAGVTISEIAERLNIPRSEVRRRRRKFVNKQMKLRNMNQAPLSVNQALNDDILARWGYSRGILNKPVDGGSVPPVVGQMTTGPRDWPSYGNFYSVLGVDRNSSSRDLKKAYIEKAKILHPDTDKTEGATERFKELQAAYETLSDDANKRMYNEWLDRQGVVDETPERRPDPSNPEMTEENVQSILNDMRRAQERMRQNSKR